MILFNIKELKEYVLRTNVTLLVRNTYCVPKTYYWYRMRIAYQYTYWYAIRSAYQFENLGTLYVPMICFGTQCAFRTNDKLLVR